MGNQMARWFGLDSVPKDGTEVLFWVPEYDAYPFGDGSSVTGRYDAPLGYYIDVHGDEILPVCWTPYPRGPRSTDEISFERIGQ